MARSAVVPTIFLFLLQPVAASAQEASAPEAPATAVPPSTAPPERAVPTPAAPQTTPAQGDASPSAPGDPAVPASPSTEAPQGPAPGAAPRGGPPSHYYVEPGGETTPPGPRRPDRGPPIYEPPPPPPRLFVYEPPPPPPAVRHRAPKQAFWTGARLGLMVPFGALWRDAYLVDGLCCVYRNRPWSDYASPGPMFEIDAGLRLGRNYTVFALWEHSFLGTGDLDENAFRGQEHGNSDFYALGVRFSTNPDTVGFLVELALGYRQFTAHWADGTELRLTEGLFDGRIGIGADIRLSRSFSLSPLITFSSGVFGDAEWSGPSISGSARDEFDRSWYYNTLSLQLGAHFDVF